MKQIKKLLCVAVLFISITSQLLAQDEAKWRWTAQSSLIYSNATSAVALIADDLVAPYTITTHGALQYSFGIGIERQTGSNFKWGVQLAYQPLGLREKVEVHGESAQAIAEGWFRWTLHHIGLPIYCLYSVGRKSVRGYARLQAMPMVQIAQSGSLRTNGWEDQTFQLTTDLEVGIDLPLKAHRLRIGLIPFGITPFQAFERGDDRFIYQGLRVQLVI